MNNHEWDYYYARAAKAAAALPAAYAVISISHYHDPVLLHRRGRFGRLEPVCWFTSLETALPFRRYVLDATYEEKAVAELFLKLACPQAFGG